MWSDLALRIVDSAQRPQALGSNDYNRNTLAATVLRPGNYALQIYETAAVPRDVSPTCVRFFLQLAVDNTVAAPVRWLALRGGAASRGG